MRTRAAASFVDGAGMARWAMANEYCHANGCERGYAYLVSQTVQHLAGCVTE